MRLMRRLFSAAVVALVFGLAVASPSSAAWSTRTNFGSPGAVQGIDSVAVQGGVCGNPEPMAYKCTASSQYNQIFVSNYIAYAAPYSGAQTIRSTAYLYYYNGSTGQWTQYRSWSYAPCYPVWQGQYCTFGFSSPTTGSAPWQPAFIDLQRGFSWTVAVKVDWYSYSTGQALASASYYPGVTASDIGCAYYASTLLKPARCTGPANSAGTGYIIMP